MRLTRRLSPSRRSIDTARVAVNTAHPVRSGRIANRTARCLLAFVASGAGGANLAESLWTPGAGDNDAVWHCPGGYLAPPATLPSEGTGPLHPVEMTSDVMTVLGGRTDAEGSVEIRQGNRLLSARSATYDDSTSVANASGSVRFDEPGLSVSGTAASVDLAAGRSSVDDAEFVLTDLDMRGQAARIEWHEGRVELDSAMITTCPPGAAAWRIEARAIRLDDDVATSRHARLMLGRVPVFYAPYLRFSVSGARTSGFLVPDIDYSGKDGFDLSVPYYLNLAPNYDATLTPRWVEQRGFGIESEFRHKGRWSDTQLDAAILSGDRDYDGELSRSESRDWAGEFSPSDRWSLQIDHHGRIGGLRTDVDFAAVSDNDYFGDLRAEQGVASRVSLERRGEIQYARGGLVARLLAQGHQRLEPGPQPYRRLPEAGASYRGQLAGPLAFSMHAAWAAFDGPTGVVDGKRYHLEPRLRFAVARPWGFLNLSGGLRRTGYDLVNVRDGVDPRPTRDVQVGIADAGVFLERDLPGTSAGWIQTLEPRLYYLHQSYAEQQDLPAFDAALPTFSFAQFFRDNRFAGLDRIGDANRLSLGLTSRLLDGRGNEVVAARLGAVAHLADRRVTFGSQERPDADVVGELMGSLGRVRLFSKFAWDVAGDELDELGVGVSYRPDARRIVNVGYRRRFPDVDQTDVSFHWPIPGTEAWNVFGRWNHDWEYGRIIESFAGFEFANCCIAVKLLWHRTIDAPRNLAASEARSDGGLMLQVALKGLAGFGSKVDSRLVRGIKGYRAAARDRREAGTAKSPG